MTLQQYEDQVIDILTEGNEIEQFYEESTNFEILYQETLTLINDLGIKRTERTTTHTQPITESVVRDEDYQNLKYLNLEVTTRNGKAL